LEDKAVSKRKYEVKMPVYIQTIAVSMRGQMVIARHKTTSKKAAAVAMPSNIGRRHSMMGDCTPPFTTPTTF
jgi:hypothetical protein